MKWLRSLDRISPEFLGLGGLVCLFFPCIILVIVVERKICCGVLPLWMHDIPTLLMWAPTFLGLAYVWRQNRHVTVDVIAKLFHGRAVWVFDLLKLGISLILSLIMLWAGSKACWLSWATQKKTLEEFPEYIFSGLIPIGILVFVYEIVRRAISWKPREIYSSNKRD